MVTTKERLVIVHADLAFALPADADLDEVFTDANCLLIPLQRVNGGTTRLIDYSFARGVSESPTPVEGYDYDEGFTDPEETTS